MKKVTEAVLVLNHECETPLDGAIQHKWTCKKCGTVWIVTGMDERANPEYEKLEDFYA